VDPELVRREEGVAIRADPVVGDVAEIEKPGEPTATFRPSASRAKTSAIVQTRRK
jgi:hypothetical protein